MTAIHTEVPKSMLFAGNMPVDGVISVLGMEPFISGAQPHSRSVEITEVAADAPLLPDGVDADLVHEHDGLRSHVATGPGWTLTVLRRRAGAAIVRACATSAAVAEEILAAAVATARPAEPGESQVSVGFWHADQCGAGGVRAPRTVDLPSWQEIRPNYPLSTLDRLDRVMTLRPESVAGRLLLLHGPAGTGKTTAIRALAYEWRDWCQVDSVLDPERLFTDPAYLNSVVLGEQTTGGRHRWRLLVLEDCDELVRADAKHDSGQALSRLLNLTDGLLGQGLDVLVCLTTNENVTRLHPAVVRAGRCLAEVEIGRLPRPEAAGWLGAAPETLGADGATLAELYELRRSLTV